MAEKTTEDSQLPSEFYDAQKNDRTQYEDRAKAIAKLTLPYVIREESDTGTTAMTDGTSQSYGGRLINTLKAKMGMALMPPSTSSFRYVPNPEELAALTQGSPDNAAKVYQVLSANVSIVNAAMELQQIRSSLFDIITQLLIVGSLIVEKKKDKGVIIHPIQSFVAELDEQGHPLKMCFVENLSVLPDGITLPPEKVKDTENGETYELYTMATLDTDGKGSWTVSQEIEQEIVGKEQKYKDYDDLPYRYLGWTWMVGDSYHRPYTEDYYQDLQQLDKLAKLLTDGAIVQAKVLLFVNEKGGRTRKDMVADSSNGDIIDGVADDVTALQIQKNFDFQVPMEREQQLQKTLSQAFLMNESVTRDAERVTAQEIDFMARELESSSLAGIYSKLSLQWSKWIVHQVMLEAGIKFESIEVEILTGLDALGRSQEAQKLDGLLQRAEMLGLRGWFNDSELLNRYASFEGVNTVGLIKTPKEVEAEQAKAKEAQTAQVGEEAMAESGGAALGEQVATASGQGQQQQQQQ